MLYSVNSQYGKTGIAGRRERNVTPINKILDNAGKAAVVIRSALIVPVKTNLHLYVSRVFLHRVLTLQLYSIYTHTAPPNIYTPIPEVRANGLITPHSTFHEYHS